MNSQPQGALGRPAPGSAEAQALDAERALSNEEDQRLIAQFLAGDKKGFEDLYVKYRERVFAITLATGEVADDILATVDARA